MKPSPTVVFRTLKRLLLVVLATLLCVGGTSLWGLWKQGNALDRAVFERSSEFAALEHLQDGISIFQVSLLRFMQELDADLTKPHAALELVYGALTNLDGGADGPIGDIAAGVVELKRGLEQLEHAADNPTLRDQLQSSFRHLSQRAYDLNQKAAEAAQHSRSRWRQEGRDAAAAAARLRTWLIAGIAAACLLLLATMVFTLRRLQGPFNDILAFMHLASEKDLRGQISAGTSDEMGTLAKAAVKLSTTLVETIGTLRQVAHENWERGAALEVGASEARKGAEQQLSLSSDGVEKARAVEEELPPLAQQSRGLRDGAEQAAASVQQILAMTQQVRAEMEGVSRRVGNSTRSVQDLSEASSRVTQLAEQVGSAAQTVASAAVAIDQATQTLATKASTGRALSGVVVQEATQGRDSMAEALLGMERIREAVEASVRSFTRLDEELARVGGITQVIGDIAGRTNLLSLNAGIIAAQAGEHGRAFGVVATEIRTLAEKTAASTRQIQSLLDGLLSGGREAAEAVGAGAERVREGERLAHNTGQLLDSICRSADDAARLLADIESEVGGQSQEVARVAGQIRQVSAGVTEIEAEVRDQEKRARDIHGDLVEIEQVASQTTHAADEQTRGTELITHSMVEVSTVSEKVDTAIARVGGLLTDLRQDLESLGDHALGELTRIAQIEVEGKGFAALAGQLQGEVAQFHLPDPPAD